MYWQLLKTKFSYFMQQILWGWTFMHVAKWLQHYTVFQSLNFGGQPFRIHLQNYFLNKFIIVLEFFWVCQIKCIDCTQHHCTGLCKRFNLLQNHFSLNNNADVIILSKNSPFLFNHDDAHVDIGQVFQEVISLSVLYLNDKKLLLEIVFDS